MTIRNEEELKMFENILNRCKSTVLLVTMEGEKFDLTTPMGRIQGINAMLGIKHDYEEPELFISLFEDTMLLFEYLDYCRNVA